MSEYFPDTGPGSAEVPYPYLQGPAQGEVTERIYTELGKSGLRRWGGYVDEEFLPQLQGRKAVQIYKEMHQNDPIIGAMLFSVDMLLRQVSWRVEPGSNDQEGQLAAMFVEECMNDMSHTWDDLISEILSMLVFGWSWHEVVYKRRVGMSTRNPALRSRHADGLIGWRKIPIRSQETLLEWEFDEDGGVQALVQMAPPDFERKHIPIDKSLLFRSSTHKNNPEGRSILRNAYRPWYFKKKIEEIEGIGVERDLAGLPVAKIPAQMLSPNASEADRATAEMFKKLVSQVRRDEQEGLVLPLDYDPETKQELYQFELLSTSATRQFDTDKIITRYEQRMAMTILADFILLGNDAEGKGSYAMHTNKTGVFRTGLNSWAHSIADVFNRYELPRLFALNNWNLEKLPQIVPGEVDPPDLAELGEFINKISGAGMQLFPDPDLEAFLRDVAKLPEKSEETEILQANAMAQQQAMQLEQAEAMGQMSPGDEGGFGQEESL